MKKPYIIILLLLAGVLFSGCGNISMNNTGNVPVVTAAKSIVPNISETDATKVDFTFEESEKSFQTAMAPRIQVKPEDVVLQVINTNLDIDTADEQIMLLKKRDDPQGSIRVAVVDFDTVRNTYKLSWEAETQAVNMRSFNINLEDVVGDHNLELVCSGTNKDREQTLDVFRKTQGPTGIGMYYEPILSLHSDGTIEIERQDRSQAYNLGQKNGISFLIISNSHDEESENLLDMVRTEYFWSYQTGVYTKGTVEKIPGKKVEEQQLQKLFVSGESAFEEFVDGIWYKLDPKNTDTLVILDTNKKTINFYQKDIQEVYRWISSYKTRLPNVLYINGKNDLVPFINIFLSIEVLSVNSISISISEGEFSAMTGNQWNGLYYKLAASSPDKVIGSSVQEIKTVQKSIDGRYEASDGKVLQFSYPSFVLEEKGTIKNGGYALSMLNVPVLEMKVIDETGLVKEIRSYSYSLTKGEETGNVSLVLQQGTITVAGFQKGTDDPVVYEQKNDVQNPL
ncbi:MAG: pallilysin-related adhesin [Spirochaetales bacterium]|nr:MAG: pallilysin-related adhesin [Spirochaetales bacterium]